MFELAGVLIAAIAMIAGVYNVAAFVKSVKADHDRRRKQATFEYVGDRVRETLTALDLKLRFRKISDSECEKIYDSVEESAEMVRYLGVLEHISIGVNRDIYDKDILYDMSATYIVNMYRQIVPYIHFLRKKLAEKGINTTGLYIEFENLALEFDEKINNSKSVQGFMVNRSGEFDFSEDQKPKSMKTEK